ncbi:NAC transcription factor 32-like [Solanum lycopersicum]|nr:NAC transcription factor 32-like [Solanum lycopersicum]
MESYEKNMAFINSNFENPNPNDFVFPVGYRFCPRDDELITHYLLKRIRNEVLPHDKIKEVNLYKYSPYDLAEIYPELGEKEWYFFTPRNRKYPNGHRPNRAAGRGYWKATGADKPIIHNNVTVGFRKALVFYEGKPPKGLKTNWIMHEYRVNESRRIKMHAADMKLDDWVLCMIYKRCTKSKDSKKQKEQEDELEDASKINSAENYEWTMDSCLIEFAKRQFEDPYQYLNMSENVSIDCYNNTFPIIDFNNLYQVPLDNLYQNPYYNTGTTESQNVLDDDSPDDKSTHQ